MNWKNIFTVYRKELRDMLRDRRTVISMIVIPTLLMPVLMFGIGFISVKVMKQAQAAVPSIMILGGGDSPKLVAELSAHPKFKIVPTTEDWKNRISDKKVRAAVEIPAGFEAALDRHESMVVKIFNYGGEMRSKMAADELRRFLDGYSGKEIAARLAQRGLQASFIKPIEIKSENVAPPEKVGGNAVGGIIPYFLLILAFTGAMYPAMDLTAGEKERGTLETILCSPLSRLDLVLGKFFMVLTASLSTVVFSLLSMGATFVIGGILLASGSGAGGAIGGAAKGASRMPTLPSLDPTGMLGVVIMVLPMAVLFAATLLAISLFAKSFKEAQSYVSPLIMVIVMPAVIGMLPGVELNPSLALVPILNVSLVSKELVSGVWHWHYIALIFGSSCVYAAVALAFAVKMFNRESVIFRS
ncbi:MAG TPA: ABC transporter permease [Opitutaceae bacterium]|nr:ABC transporter permease [Opitutaceae bacterium]